MAATQNGMTFEQLEEYQKQMAAEDRAKQQETGQQTVRKGGGYTNAPVNENSILLEKAIHDDLTYYTPGTVRTIQEGTSGADEYLLSDEGYSQIQALKNEWQRATAAGDTAAAQAAHDAAEAIRAQAGYSGGADGGGYTVVQRPQTQQVQQTTPSAGAGAGSGTGSGTGGNSQKSLLDQWKQAAIDQSNSQIDYAVQQAVTELERALADAQPQFKEQAESVAKEEMQGRDNAALYAEARGDKGGIGQSQYNEIMAAAAQNRLAVQQAQTKLSTDTARQIADLRAQGEFEKADKVLEITQQYLSQLISLEQWAAEFGLTQQQFQASLDQWQAEYDLALRQYDDSLAQTQSGQYADMGSALLSAGIMPTGEQLTAMGMTESQAQEYIMQMQLEAAQKGQTGSGDGEDAQVGDVYTWLAAQGAVDYGTAYQLLRNAGYGTTDAKAYAEYFSKNMEKYAAPEGDPGTGSGSIVQEHYQVLDEMVKKGAGPYELFLVLDSFDISEDEKEMLAKFYGIR